MWAAMSDDELIQRSDLIVIGEWLGQASVTLPGAAAAVELGVVAVAETWKGSGERSVVHVLAVPAQAPRSGSDLRFQRGDRGLWLLREQAGGRGLFLADHPQRFVAAISGKARIDVLRQRLKVSK
jgi:hypothetical protein